LYAKVKDFSTPFVVIFGQFALFYAVAGLGWMLIFSLVLTFFVPLKIYVAGLLLLTLLWIILSILTGQSDSAYKQTTDHLHTQQRTLEFYAQKITLLTSRYEKLCAEKGMQYATASNNKSVLDKLKGKISFLTPNVLENEAASTQMSVIFSKCESIIEETEAASDSDLTACAQKMQRFVDNAIAELDMLKQISRK
jgi:hypothetical protein